MNVSKLWSLIVNSMLNFSNGMREPRGKSPESEPGTDTMEGYTGTSSSSGGEATTAESTRIPHSPRTLDTLNGLFFTLCERDQPECMLRRTRSGSWEAISAREFAAKVAGVFQALRSWGFHQGDRAAILSENRYEWVVADFACLMLGAVVVPIYPTLTAEQTAYILRDSGARAIFVSSETQLAKLVPVLNSTAIEKVILMDEGAASASLPMADLMRSPADPEFESIGSSARPDQPATIIYTSGTTGAPKGVMLTHGNMAANINGFLREFGFTRGMSSISFLPLSHVTARSVDLGLLYCGVTLAYLPQVDQLPGALREIRPHIFLSVPRIYEKLHTRVVLNAAKFPRHKLYRWALTVGRAHRAEVLAGSQPRSPAWQLANRVVYAKLRQALGGRVEILISGGAPLGRELAEWYADMGIRIFEGYGLTETSPVVAVNTPAAHRIGSVGKPLSNVEVRIAEDGEILVRGPSVFKGYWNQPEETRRAFVDGWFKTGDIGRLDGDGFLYVTDRKKDLLKTAGGKFIAPQPIESSLKHQPLIAEAVVIGDRQKFPAVLIFPDFPALESWAAERGLQFSSRRDLLGCAEVQSHYSRIISQLNLVLARFEQLKKFRLIEEELSPADGTLTASLKLRRRSIAERYRREIDEIYAGAESARDLQ
jgi:long-chain acyl-CoA synthetase